MKVFTPLLFAVLFSVFFSSAFGQVWPQQNSRSLLPTSAADASSKTNFNVTACGGTVKSLDATAAPEEPAQGANTGAMNNDTWFAFTTKATVAKIRVCDPTFDAAVEVFTLDGTFITSFNVGGDGEREYGVATGLTYNQVYAARVGRVSGTGGGTFSFSVECFPFQLKENYTPSPPGASCYTPNVSILRTLNPSGLNPSSAISNTRWYISPLPLAGEPAIVCSAPGPLNLASCHAFCLNTDYQALCEVRATDAECGTIWWGTSEPKLMNFCDQVCPTITSPSPNASLINIRNTVYNIAALGAGSQVQWKFVTDNGATEVCSQWLSTAAFTPFIDNTVLANCLEFGKFYNVYARARYCSSDPDPAWCQSITVYSQPMPVAKINPSFCCKWQSRFTNLTVLYENFPMNQYRFRFTPVANSQNPCPSANLAPIGPAVVTGWGSNSFVSCNNSNIINGTTYSVQVQGRILGSNCSNCSGSSYAMPTRFSDWGSPCLVGIRATSSPPAGTELSCGCSAEGMYEWNEQEYEALISQFGTIEIGEDEIWEGEEENNQTLSVYSISQGTLQVNMADLQMQGESEIRIHDLNGRLIASRPVFSAEDKNALLISINGDLPAGIYVVSVIGQNSVVTEKIFISGY